MPREVELPANSRYSLTDVYESGGRTLFGITVMPSIRLDGNERVVVVGHDRANTLHHISHKVYGTKDFWWAIGVVNNIMNPLADLVNGMALTIPTLANIQRALEGASVE